MKESKQSVEDLKKELVTELVKILKAGVFNQDAFTANINALKEAGVDLNAPAQTLADGATFTALGIAAYFGKVGAINTLIKAGVNLNAPVETLADGATFTALGNCAEIT